MKRGIVLGMLLALGGLVAVKAQPPAPDAPKMVDVEKVNDRLYVLRQTVQMQSYQKTVTVSVFSADPTRSVPFPKGTVLASLWLVVTAP